MNHNTLVIEIKSTLDKLIDARTSLGYDYIVYGLLLINEDQTRVSNITKALYIDIAAHYETSWSCVEKNIRNTVNAIWTSENKTILEMIFNRTCMDKNQRIKNFLNIYTILFSYHKKPPLPNQKKMYLPSSALSVTINVRYSKACFLLWQNDFSLNLTARMCEI